MSTIDLSRVATDPRKHYAGVRMQQGRVLTDDDFNEAGAIDAEELRRTRLHAIGAYGTPDAGFLPKNLAVVAGRCDFTLSAGTLYLGGQRLEMNPEERFLLQKDWLNFNPATDAPAAPANGATRTDMVWIETWQQPVTAVEDSELFEVALGGPDTSTRWRTMRRVHVTPGVVQDECAEAWAAVSAGFAAGLGAVGTLNAEMEVVTTATLTVSFTASPASGDLCAPPLAGGYLGAENQAVRVQLVSATHYTWGYDNAAPLYRAQVTAVGGAAIRVKLLNQPRDAAHWPLSGQVVELLPWSAALSNGERPAEIAGHLCKVAVSYDPDTQTLDIDTPLPAGFGAQWQARADVASFFDGSAEQNFFYLRVWNRGDDLVSPAAIPIATPALGNTGLQVAFGGGPLRAGDHWIIAARPAAPDVVTPWQLLSGAPANGLRRWRAPLALLRWSTAGGVTTGQVIHDCRPPFLPLTRIRGCCSVTVGDGTHSFGMFTSINAAIAALPPSGGTVCILPGRYVESVVIDGLRRVTLHGCGPASRIVAASAEGPGSNAVRIVGSRDVAVETLALEGGIEAVVHVEDSGAVRLASCLVQARDQRDRFSPWPAVFVRGQAIELLDNIIEVMPPEPEDLLRIFHPVAAPLRAVQALSARGGIQLAGGCEHVRVADNVIVGGGGNGITLGSILRIDVNNPDGRDVPDIDVDDPCAPCDPTDNGVPPGGGNGGVRFESGGDLYDIRIEDNLITRHGANGISVVRFFGSAPGDAFGGMPMIVVHGLAILRNRILRCLHRAVAKPTTQMQLFLGYGGISLAFATDLEIEDNTIERNGRDWLSPVCGVFVLVVDGLRIERNRIVDNGPRNDEPPDAAQPGLRAGVHVWLALALQAALGNAKADAKQIAAGAAPERGRQIRVHGNQVEQPLGRALFMLGAGPMHISDNRLASEGLGAPGADPLATTVLVLNLGISREWNIGLLLVLLLVLYYRLIGKPAPDNIETLICTFSRVSVLLPGIWLPWPTGKTLFTDNQVSFQMRDAPRGFSASSALLASLDDVGANDNQFEFHAQQHLVIADLLALGQSVRSNDNRLAETWGRALRSVLSLALQNTAADNQSTHCITAFGLQRAVHDNLVLAQLFCEDACGGTRLLAGQLVTGAQMTVGPKP
jgi:hypothetical protein